MEGGDFVILMPDACSYRAHDIKQGFSSGEKKKRSQSRKDGVSYPFRLPSTIKMLNLHNTKLFGSAFSTILHSKLGTL